MRVRIVHDSFVVVKVSPEESVVVLARLSSCLSEEPQEKPTCAEMKFFSLFCSLDMIAISLGLDLSMRDILSLASLVAKMR